MDCNDVPSACPVTLIAEKPVDIIKTANKNFFFINLFMIPLRKIKKIIFNTLPPI